MIINAFCHHCNKSQDVRVVSFLPVGCRVEVNCECNGWTYRAPKPHHFTVSLGLAVWQALCAKHGHPDDKEDIP